MSYGNIFTGASHIPALLDMSFLTGICVSNREEGMGREFSKGKDQETRGRTGT